MKRRDLIGTAALALALIAGACDSGEGDEGDGGTGGSGGIPAGDDVAPADMVGDWVITHSDSAAYVGATGDRLVYFRFLDETNLCVANCREFGDFAAPCPGTEYGCACHAYSIANGILSVPGSAPVTIRVEDDGGAWEGQAEVNGGVVLNRYARTDDLPAGAASCRR